MHGIRKVEEKNENLFYIDENDDTRNIKSVNGEIDVKKSVNVGISVIAEVKCKNEVKFTNYKELK